MKRKKYITVKKRIKKKRHHHKNTDASRDENKSPILEPPPLPIPEIQPLKELITSEKQHSIYCETEENTENEIPTKFIPAKRRLRTRGTRTLDPDEMSQGSRNINFLFDIEEKDHNDNDDKFSTTPQSPISFFKSNSREIFNLEENFAPHRLSDDSISGFVEPPILDLTDDLELSIKESKLKSSSIKETEINFDENVISEKKKRKKKKTILIKKKKRKDRNEVAHTLDDSDFKKIILPSKKKSKRKKDRRPVTMDPEETSPKKLIPEQDKKPTKGIDIMCVILDYPTPEELAPFQMPIRNKPIPKETPSKKQPPPQKAVMPQKSQHVIAEPHVHFDFNDVPVKIPPIRRKRKIF